MKAAIPLVLMIFALTGCASFGAAPGDPGYAASSFPSSDAASTPVPDPFPPSEDMGPRLIIPATGGSPVVGIPIGGNVFVPVTGGPPVPGFPISP